MFPLYRTQLSSFLPLALTFNTGSSLAINCLGTTHCHWQGLWLYIKCFHITNETGLWTKNVTRLFWFTCDVTDSNRGGICEVLVSQAAPSP